MNALTLAFADADRSYNAAKQSGTQPGAALTGGGLGGVSLQSSKLTKAAEQYKHFRGWSYVAISRIASKIAGQDLFVGKVLAKSRPGSKLVLPNFAKSLGTRFEPLPSHKLIATIDAPNPLMVRWSLMFSTVASLLLTGRAFWWLADTADGLQIWPIPSSWIEPTDNLRGSWKLRPPGQVEPIEVDGQSIVPFLLPDPSDPFGSVSPLQSQALAVSTDESIQRCQFDSFARGVFPQLAVRIGTGNADPVLGPSAKPVLTPEQRAELVGAIRRLYQGEGNRHEPLVLDGMIEGFDKLSLNNAEMEYLDSGKQTKARILQAFGVNPIIAGEIENANRASAVVANENFCEHTINPIIELMSQTLTRWLAPRYSDRLLIWLECCKAHDAEQTLAEWKAAAASGFVTQNEFRTHVLNLEAVDGGDTFRDSLGNPIERSAPAFDLRHANGHAVR